MKFNDPFASSVSSITTNDDLTLTPFDRLNTPGVSNLGRDRSAPSGNLGLGGDFDMSFLDLLTDMASTDEPSSADTSSDTDKVAKKPDAPQPDKNVPPKLTLVAHINKAEPEPSPTPATHHDSSSDDDPQKMLTLVKDALTPIDLQYMKEIVIPGLPILVGAVPFQSVFQTNAEDEISYVGGEISSNLAELIQQGYRSGAPIRVELDSDSAVVLRIRDGQVSAEFVAASAAAMDQATILSMQQELTSLRNRMLARNLPVGTLEYKPDYQDPNQSGRNPNQQQNQSSSSDGSS